MPGARPRPAIPSYRGHATGLAIPADLHQELVALARARGVTLFMVLHAAVAVLLARLGAGTDIPLGAPIAGRTDEALDDLVGFFVNNLVLRADVSGDPAFTEVLDRVRATALDAFDHQDVPFEYLVEVLAPQRAQSRHPLFQVMVAVQNNTAAHLDLPGLAVTALPASTVASRFDLEVAVSESFRGDGAPAGLGGTLTVSADLFDPDAAPMLASRLTRVLRAVTADPGIRMRRVRLLDQAERAQVLGTRNDAARARTLPGLFEARAARVPDAVAVACGDQVVTYAALDAAADHVAGTLAGAGVRAESAVGVLVSRSAEFVVAVLGVLKSGGAYLPVHPRLPASRVAWQLGDAGARVVVADRARADVIPAGTRVLWADEVIRPGAGAPPARAWCHPDRLAYIMYTSGSTGTAKGVGVRHRDVAALAADRGWAVGHERVLMHSPPAFDASTYELWVPLLAGGQVIVAAGDQREAGDLQAAHCQRAGDGGLPDHGPVQRHRRDRPGRAGRPARDLDRRRDRLTGRDAAGAGRLPRRHARARVRPHRDHHLRHPVLDDRRGAGARAAAHRQRPGRHAGAGAR